MYQMSLPRSDQKCVLNEGSKERSDKSIKLLGGKFCLLIKMAIIMFSWCPLLTGVPGTVSVKNGPGKESGPCSRQLPQHISEIIPSSSKLSQWLHRMAAPANGLKCWWGKWKLEKCLICQLNDVASRLDYSNSGLFVSCQLRFDSCL